MDGVTVAVLACGIDQIYPRAHELLLAAIKQRGAVVSELPPRSTPTRFRFLHRNRLIAALGAGTVVVEAAQRSGSLVTARLAGELGRPVMAVPGPITSDLSAGSHALVRDGAILVTSARDIQEACLDSPVTTRQRRPDPAADRSTAAVADPVTDPVAELVLEALPLPRAAQGADVLVLARATGIGPDRVLAVLGRLAATGQAVRTGSGWQLAAPPPAATRGSPSGRTGGRRAPGR